MRYVPVVSASAAAERLEPNTLYIWGEISELRITMLPGRPDVVNEYLFQFSSPIDRPTSLILPDTVKWVRYPVIEGGKTYQVSVINDIGVMAGV